MSQKWGPIRKRLQTRVSDSTSSNATDRQHAHSKATERTTKVEKYLAFQCHQHWSTQSLKAHGIPRAMGSMWLKPWGTLTTSASVTTSLTPLPLSCALAHQMKMQPAGGHWQWFRRRGSADPGGNLWHIRWWLPIKGVWESTYVTRCIPLPDWQTISVKPACVIVCQLEDTVFTVYSGKPSHW